MEDKENTPKEAMEELIKQGYSKYRISQSLDMQPIMVDRYLKEETKTMRETAVQNLLRDFGIVIDKNYMNGQQKTPWPTKTMWVDKTNVLRS